MWDLGYTCIDFVAVRTSVFHKHSVLYLGAARFIRSTRGTRKRIHGEGAETSQETGTGKM